VAHDCCIEEQVARASNYIGTAALAASTAMGSVRKRRGRDRLDIHHGALYEGPELTMRHPRRIPQDIFPDGRASDEFAG
jgi:hypothetical protein